MTRPRLLFTYWGRRGPITTLMLELGAIARTSPDADVRISVSRQNENFARFAFLRDLLDPVDTFASSPGSANLCRIWRLRRRLRALLIAHRIDAVIELMPHVWSPFVMPVVRQAGARYATVVHDAEAHPGDRTSWANALMERCIPLADRVVTLSESVAWRLVASGRAPASRVATSFHPDLRFPGLQERSSRPADAPMRLLFLGRILPYKGLPLFLDMIDVLKRRGRDVQFGVFGEGALGDAAQRITALGGELVNRWLTDDEIAAILPRYDAMVLSHTEASQSGVAAAAFGAGLPIVVTPVGGLGEQVRDGVTGMVAQRVDAEALADATERLFAEPATYEAVARRIAEQASDRSVERFLAEMAAIALAKP